MQVAIMQPYLFPYLGYFQLVQAADYFVFYNDVNFIKGGWINRNRILSNGQPNYFTVPLSGASSNKLINQVELKERQFNPEKLLRTLEQSYGNAPFFKTSFELIKSIILADFKTIDSLAAHSVIEVSNYLGLQKDFFFSSDLNFGKDSNNRVQRLIDITKGLKSRCYINAKGGEKLYQKKDFKVHGIELLFLEAHLYEYPQQTTSFYPNLSIVDVLMNNEKGKIQEMLKDYILV